MKTAVIWGALGQDSLILSEQLLARSFRVVAVKRRSSSGVHKAPHLLKDPRYELIEGDVTDPFNVRAILENFRPEQVYNLAAMSHVATSFNEPFHTNNVTFGGCLNILEALRSPTLKNTRFYQASSSEMFGDNQDPDHFQRETTPFRPCSPYAIAKLAAHHLVNVYRWSYGIFACAGILFNHSSPYRPETFVCRKITKYVGDLKRALDSGEKIKPLRLGNLDAYRDWGWAGDYCRAMTLMLEQPSPADYVIATGKAYSVRDFVERAFNLIGVPWREQVVFDQNLLRPKEVPYLRGDASKARTELGWISTVDFEGLVRLMVEAELR